MTGYTPSVAAVHSLGVQNFPRMAPKTVVVHRLDAGMRFMAFIAIEPRHRDLFRERCSRRGAVTGQTPFSARNEPAGFLR